MVDANDRLLQEIAFSKAKGICGSTARELLDRIGGLSKFFSLSQAELYNLSGVNTEIYSESYRKRLLEESEKDVEFVRTSHIDTLFIDDENYPRRLQDCEDAPVILHRFGSCDLDSAHMVSIVGTRNATPYGADFTAHLVEGLAKKIDGLVIVSGLAYGIDIAAHRAALANGVPTVGVLAHDLHQIYPAVHRQIALKMASSGGALVTEYPLGTRPHKNHFLARNRIIAGLSDCVVVVESDFRGGSMSTARIASQYNRDVYAVPGRVNDKYSHGTNYLIANHTAALIQSADDIIEMMGWEVKDNKNESEPTLFRALNIEEQQIVDYITKHPEATVNDICVKLNKSYSAISDIVFQLEMDDIIMTLPGGRFAPTTGQGN